MDSPRSDSTPEREAPSPQPACDLPLELAKNTRILIVDDNPAIHEDFRKVLGGNPAPKATLLEVEAALFGEAEPAPPAVEFILDSAHQGQEALEKVKRALEAGQPYAMAFMDVRMPPGWDGVETVSRIWQLYPELQVVMCTAYSDYSWEEMIQKLGCSDNLVLLKKPFDSVEVLQLASALTRKWDLARQAHLKLEELTAMVARRTRELEASNTALRHEAEERARTERQLQHAQKMEAVGQLAAGVAHDFNNILTVVHGHASLLLMQLGETGVHARSLSEIRQASERAANLVRQLLMFGRKQVLQYRNVDLGEVVRSLSSMLRQMVSERVDFRLECAAGLSPIFADRGMLEQVVVNLVVNARDAMPRGGELLLQTSQVKFTEASLGQHPDARPGEFNCLTVKDNGNGMDAHVLRHLFEPFFTTKEVGKGTGLGLATVYGIVRQHHGWIEVQSQVNVGSTFHIYFPASHRASPRQLEPQTQHQQLSGTETILVAEDDPSLRDLVSESLRLQGYRVLPASDGPAAVRIWKDQGGRIDLLLTDMVMPGGMLGTDLAAELRRVHPGLRVIFTTGYSPGTAGLAKSLESGSHFLPKPYSPVKLGELVRRCLDDPASS
jgi:signal transduction histidine kinase